MQPSHLCAAIHSLMCAGIPPPPRMRGSPLFFTVRPLLVVQINTPLNFDCDVMIAMSLPPCFLCTLAGFSRERFKTSSLCDSFIAACHWTDDGPYYGVGGWCMVCVCKGGKYNWYLNVTVVER